MEARGSADGRRPSVRPRQRLPALSACRRCRLGHPFVGDDDAVAHGYDAVGIGGDVGLVGNEDDGDSLLAIERAERFHDLVRGSRIEIAGRLIGEKKARCIDQRAGNRDALLLAAGELAGRIALALPQAEKVQRRARPLDAHGAALRPRRGVIERQADILDGAGAGQEIEALENKAEPFAADAGEVRFAQRRDIDALQEIMAAGRQVEAAENIHERRLARARRAHDGDELAGLDGQADAAERFDLDIAEDESAGYILDLMTGCVALSVSRGIGAPTHLRGAAAANPIGRSRYRGFRR
jgi:hypothetical protein